MRPWEAEPVQQSDDRWQDAVVEVPLLLTAGQAVALEDAATALGTSVGQQVRLLVRDFLDSRRPQEFAYSTSAAGPAPGSSEQGRTRP
jgi:hypothetical protein